MTYKFTQKILTTVKGMGKVFITCTLKAFDYLHVLLDYGYNSVQVEGNFWQIFVVLYICCHYAQKSSNTLDQLFVLPTSTNSHN